jgi:hypothetical protein
VIKENTMKKLIGSMLLGVLIGSAAALVQAQDEETLLEFVLDNCEEDIEEYCDRVTPGDGRVAMCLAAYEDQISGACTLALYDAAAVINALADEIVYLGEACATDIDELCGGTSMGEGRLLSCLSEQRDKVSDGCDEALGEIIED